MKDDYTDSDYKLVNKLLKDAKRLDDESSKLLFHFLSMVNKEESIYFKVSDATCQSVIGFAKSIDDLLFYTILRRCLENIKSLLSCSSSLRGEFSYNMKHGIIQIYFPQYIRAFTYKNPFKRLKTTRLPKIGE